MSEIAKNHMVLNPESTELVEQVACRFSQENLGWHGQNEQEHYHGGAENFLLSTCLAAFLHSCTKSTKNLQIVLFVNCLAFWCVFVMHNATRIK